MGSRDERALFSFVLHVYVHLCILKISVDRRPSAM